MATKASGTVENITSRSVTARGKPGTAYAVEVDGERYSAGFDKPDCNIGDVVEFEYEMNGNYRNIVKGSLRKASPKAAASSGGYSGGRGKGVFPVPQDDGSIAILRQNALTNAVAFLNASGFLSGSDDLEEKQARVIDVAKYFASFTSGELDELEAELAAGGMGRDMQ